MDMDPSMVPSHQPSTPGGSTCGSVPVCGDGDGYMDMSPGTSVSSQQGGPSSHSCLLCSISSLLPNSIHMCACVRARVRACVRVCVRACMRMHKREVHRKRKVHCTKIHQIHQDIIRTLKMSKPYVICYLLYVICYMLSVICCTNVTIQEFKYKFDTTIIIISILFICIIIHELSVEVALTEKESKETCSERSSDV